VEKETPNYIMASDWNFLKIENKCNNRSKGEKCKIKLQIKRKTQRK